VKVGVPPRCLGRSTGLLVALAVPLAWLSGRLLAWLDAPVPHPAPSVAMLTRLLWWGPLMETALLLLAAFAVNRMAIRRRQRDGEGLAACTLIVGASFLAAHLLQFGPAALASAPAALLLAGVAAHAAQQPARQALLTRGPALFAMHAAYNASVLWMG
jgi:heme/copper-type cytochrome/quinol oxidase subunit 3